MTDNLWIDAETFNLRDISVGTYAYAETAEPLIITYALNNEDVKLWDRTIDPTMPKNLAGWIEDPRITVTAHHAMFDRIVLLMSGIADIARERWRCTMVQALAHSLPGSLDLLGQILGLPGDKAKIKDGKRLIRKFCCPAPSNHKADRYDRHSDPEDWQRFCDYAIMDIVAMREIAKQLPDLNYRGLELELYHLDQEINDRGFFVDRELVDAGVRAAITEKEHLASRFITLTRGEVERPSKRADFKDFLNDNYDLGLDNTRAATFNELLNNRHDLPEDCRELMQISILSNKTSTAKYAALQPAISKDGRFRGGLQFDGAARTRRWAGRTFQPHNLPSRGLPPADQVVKYIEALKADAHDLIFDDLMTYGAASIRGVVIAPKGHKLLVSDLSNIEGRMNAWLSDETWKLEAFRAFDRGEGPDLYNVTASLLTGTPVEDIDKTQRNVMGKVPELALGYAGGVGAFQTFAKVYGIKMADQWDILMSSLGQDWFDAAAYNYKTWGKAKANGLSEKEWLASEAVKLAWRDRHPNICQFWYDCENAAKNAIKRPGKKFSAGKYITFQCGQMRGHDWLFARLPSGNFLCYYAPRIEEDGGITYMGIDSRPGSPTNGRWVRLDTYGGKIVENFCQTCARDVLALNMLEIDKEHYPLILTVHDEVITEVPDHDNYTLDELSSLLSKEQDCFKGLPLAAAGFSDYRYRKD